jgi:ABC-type multidrug transport system ATPase subunit/ABC-type multidrug transport system permease subunit
MTSGESRTRELLEQGREDSAPISGDAPANSPAMSALAEPLLVLDRVSKRFARGAREVRAVSELSHELHGGAVVLLLGPNGAGKSTLLRMIAGLVEPSAGEIRIQGRNQAVELESIRRKIGWCGSDERSFYPRLSGIENLRLFAGLHGLDKRTAEERIRPLARRFDVERAIERPFQSCSTGERQKLNLIRALLHEPRILLLDEPARSLDAASRATLAGVVAEFAARPDRLVLLAGHDFEGLEDLGQRVVILDAGREVLSGTTAEIASHLGGASWHVTFRSSAARARALEAYQSWRAGPSPEIAVAPAAQSGASPELLDCTARFAAELERIERRDGPSIHELLVLVGRGAGFGIPHVARAAESRVATGTSSASEHAPTRSTHADRPRAPALRAVGALARRDRLVFFSHRFQAGLRLGLLAAWVLSLYFVSKLVDRGSPQVARWLSGDYFTYALLGLMFLRIMQVCLVQMASALREEQLQGTIEPLVATGQPSFVLLVGMLAWPIGSEAVALLLVFGSGAWILGAELASANPAAALLAAAATVIAMAEWGLLSAAFVIAFKRGDPVALLVNLISIGLSGVYFPVELLPAWVRPLPRVIPLTWGLDAVRAAVMRGVGFASPEYVRAMTGLFVLIVVLAPIAWWSQRSAFAHARRSGTLAQA